MTKSKMYFSKYVRLLTIEHQSSMFGMGSVLVSLQCLLCANHMGAFWTLVGKHVWEVLGFNVVLEISFPSLMIADSTIEKPISRG